MNSHQDAKRVSIFPEWVPYTVVTTTNTLNLNGERLLDSGRIMWRVERVGIEDQVYESVEARQRFAIEDTEAAMKLFNEWLSIWPHAQAEILRLGNHHE